ncbi:thermonuclease family protein [Streptomyces antimicrobicus]|uniref:Thermonuclease family protein n=1 Tax=Streptomyces antimicrobicus TaxID=2883108 RepID=A0ABS8B6J2_9ACTN|nr:thermonuclease family protein [Streptomyces antimicrobicus]MCB5180212.1 thermonuclease family protein [Streptomyces antimicrobicus]
MPMLVIEGSFRVLGARPDGDSVRFVPDDPAHWDLVPGPHPVRRNKAGSAQLRLDGIDALETHYVPAHGAELHQPPPYAEAAADELIRWLGFLSVLRDAHGTVSSAEPAAVPGYVLTRGADVNGRCVALAGRGPAPAPSGSALHVDVPLLRQTANVHQLRRGLAYPTYYTKLYVDLREEMTAAVAAARQEGLGVWPLDQTLSGAKIDGLASLSESTVVLPKLFRRLADYLTLGAGDPSLGGFGAFLDQRADRVLVLPRGQFTGLSTVVEVDGQSVRLSVPPEDLVFEER